MQYSLNRLRYRQTVGVHHMMGLKIPEFPTPKQRDNALPQSSALQRLSMLIL
jgi:hypothetical protein